MTVATRRIADLPHALRDHELITERLGGRRPAVFLDYDGTLTPIVDDPAAAVLDDGMRETVRALARRCPVCVVSGRDRAVVAQLMGIDDLIIAGSHGFDIGGPRRNSGVVIEHDAATGFADLLAEVIDQLDTDLGEVPGVILEPKRSSVGVHYRLAPPDAHARVAEGVRRVLETHPDQLKITPGKFVYEIQPAIDWDKGAAVRYLIRALHLDLATTVPLYLGDDVTDEHAFRALEETGVGVIVANPDHPDEMTRQTAADFVLYSTREVRGFLDALAR